MPNPHRNLCYIIAVAIILMATVFPVLRDRTLSQHIPLSYADDTQYYAARIREIKDGFPLMGNPFYYEHHLDTSPAFFLPDWLAAIPVIIGFSVPDALALNIIVWSLITGLLLYALIRKLHRGWWGILVFGLVMSQILPNLFRPVIMQTIYPVFLLFILAMMACLEKPDSRVRWGWFATVLCASFYMYSYLWQIEVTAIGLLIIYCWLTDRGLCKPLIVSSCSALMGAIPFFLFTHAQMTNPFYWETMARIGLVHTHLPTGPAIKNGVLLILMIAGMMVIRKTWIDRRFIVLLIVAGSLLIVSFSNIFTGLELETATHVQRFSLLILALMFGVLLKYLLHRKYLLAIPIVVYGLAMVAPAKVTTEIIAPHQRQNADTFQTMIRTLDWLEKHESSPVVIYSDPDGFLNANIPIATKHYVLFSPSGALHLMSDEEQLERYVTAKTFAGLNLQTLKDEYRVYTGAGTANHQYRAANRLIMLERLLGGTQPLYSNAAVYRGEEYFENAFALYQDQIAKDPLAYLYKFHVSYLISENDAKEHWPSSIVQKLTLVYHDITYDIYRLTKI